MPNDSKERNEAFFDTSILVYAYDKNEPEKYVIASELIKKVFNKEMIGYVSNQILSELYFVLTEKKNVTKEDATNVIMTFIESDSWIKLNYDIRTVKGAVGFAKISEVMFWDILIAETMKENRIYKIYTENEKDFKKIPGIKVIDPLKK